MTNYNTLTLGEVEELAQNSMVAGYLVSDILKGAYSAQDTGLDDEIEIDYEEENLIQERVMDDYYEEQARYY